MVPMTWTDIKEQKRVERKRKKEQKKIAAQRKKREHKMVNNANFFDKWKASKNTAPAI